MESQVEKILKELLTVLEARGALPAGGKTRVEVIAELTLAIERGLK